MNELYMSDYAAKRKHRNSGKQPMAIFGSVLAAW